MYQSGEFVYFFNGYSGYEQKLLKAEYRYN